MFSRVGKAYSGDMMDVQTGTRAGDSRHSLSEAELGIDTLPIITRTYLSAN